VPTAGLWLCRWALALPLERGIGHLTRCPTGLGSRRGAIRARHLRRAGRGWRGASGSVAGLLGPAVRTTGVARRPCWRPCRRRADRDRRIPVAQRGEDVGWICGRARGEDAGTRHAGRRGHGALRRVHRDARRLCASAAPRPTRSQTRWALRSWSTRAPHSSTRRGRSTCSMRPRPTSPRSDPRCLYSPSSPRVPTTSAALRCIARCLREAPHDGPFHLPGSHGPSAAGVRAAARLMPPMPARSRAPGDG
jgi:hypothetical protein